MNKVTIEREGQRYVDEPVYAEPKPVPKITIAVVEAFGNYRHKQPIVVGYDRVRLRWMKPDGKGGLVPKFDQ